MPKFIIDINPYFVGGSFDKCKIINDIKANAMSIKDLKFIDLIDAGNGVYVFLQGEDIIYVGKCSSRSFGERISSHISKSPHGYMNNVMKKIAWLCSSKVLSQKDFLVDENKRDRTENFIKAEKIMKNLRIACISFESFTPPSDGIYIDQLEKELIIYINPLLNRRLLTQASFKKARNTFKTITTNKTYKP